MSNGCHLLGLSGVLQPGLRVSQNYFGAQQVALGGRCLHFKGIYIVSSVLYS